jgi:hypothetical protein
MTKIQVYTKKDKRLLKSRFRKSNVKSLHNIHFSTDNVLQYCRPFMNLDSQYKSFYTKTRSSLVARQVTRDVAFCSTNTLFTFASSWNKAWITGETSYITPVLDFLADDFLFFSYADKRYTSGRTWKNQGAGSKKSLSKLLSFYLEFYQRSLYSFHMYIHFQKNWHDDTRYNLYLTFTANRLFINMVSKGGLRHNYFSLSVGLFLKFLNGKKSFKKGKLIKLLLMKYVRKLLIVSEIRDLVVFTKRTPVFFTELCNSLISPIIRPFMNPFTNFMYDDTKLNSSKPKLRIKQIFFYQPKSFGSMKGPRKGRLKRKIMRRIIRTNRVCD